MGNYFMGQELTQPELPPNSPRPAATPPEGVIVTDVAPDGWTRRYLYTALSGRTPEEVLVSETPPSSPAPQAAPPSGSLQLLGGPTSFMKKMIPLRMGQAIGPPSAGAPPAPPPPPPAPALTPGTCPGPVEMADGKRIEPDDPITLKDLCEIMPLLLSAYKNAAQQRKGGAPGPGAPIPLSTGVPLPGAGFPGFGPGTGAFGGGGGGGGGPSVGPALGPIVTAPSVNPNIGPPGPPGPAGPSGAAAIDFVIKTDGNFSAGPGVFVPVPGTLINFVQGSDGPVLFLLQAVIGCSANNTQLGLRIDGSDQPLNIRVIHTFVGGVGDFLNGQHASWPQFLAAGNHTVEVLIRGASSGLLCPGTGLAFGGTVQANPSVPLALTVLHR